MIKLQSRGEFESEKYGAVDKKLPIVDLKHLLVFILETDSF
jgi:hypothetical protein